MSSRSVLNYLNCLPGNVKNYLEKEASTISSSASITIKALSEHPYLLLGGALVIAGGASWLGYRYLEERSVYACALPLMKNEMEDFTNQDLLDEIRRIPSKEREDVVQKTLPLMHDDMYGWQKARILSAIRWTPISEREDVIQKVLPLMPDNMLGEGKAKILRAIRKITAEEREDVINRTLALPHDESGGEIADMLSAIGEIAAEEREEVTQRALPLMPDDITGREIARLFRAIGRITAEEREDVIQRALPLMNHMVAWYKAGLIDAIGGIEAEDREDVIQRALPLIQEQMDGFSKVRIISEIGATALNERENVLLLALSLMRDSLSGEKKADIIAAVRNIPAEERDQRVARALEQLQADFPAEEGVDRYVYKNRVVELLETPLNQPFLPMGQDEAMAAAAALGHVDINVHAGQRDRRVKKALILLRKFQTVTDEQIQTAAKECIQYLDAHQQNRALWVLIGANSPKDYGPFFKKNGLVLDGEHTTGQEVMGRLWRFIEGLPEKEKPIALSSLIAELEKCINEDGERVCDPGKAQHVFIAVLQGRLEGVEIDDSIEIPKMNEKEEEKIPLAAPQVVSIPEAMRLFFSIEVLIDAKTGEREKIHQKINSLEKLLEAAHAFCDQNPYIDREAFIQEMKTYAAESVIQ